MLNYGAAAQNLFDYRTTDPANKDIYDFQLLLPPNEYAVESLKDIGDSAPRGMTLTNISLILESETALRLYFTPCDTNPDIIEYYIDSSGNDAQINFTAHTKGNEVYYDITGFAPSELFASKMMQFDDVNVPFYVTIGNYAKWAVNNSGDEKLAQTILALYNYDEYAKGFKDENYIPGVGLRGEED